MLTIAADLTKIEKFDDLVKKTLAKFGSIDVLINNAGTAKVGSLHNQVIKNLKFLVSQNNVLKMKKPFSESRRL